jgi:hypothetical protein
VKYYFISFYETRHEFEWKGPIKFVETALTEYTGLGIISVALVAKDEKSAKNIIIEAHKTFEGFNVNPDSIRFVEIAEQAGNWNVQKQFGKFITWPFPKEET